HYHEKGQPPFRTLTSLPFEDAKAILCAGMTEKTAFDADHFLTLRYERDKTLRELFLAIGGKPVRTAPVYFTLGENEGLKTWFDEPACVKIPFSQFDPDTVSFTYGDSFVTINPALDTGEEWWGKVFRYSNILKLVERYGFPEDPPYHMARRVFPKDKHINHCLKFVEAHVWSDGALDAYRLGMD
ncbi:MAG: hypothetical protein LBR72_02710, partial [Oscillospiraceae bacterium]|nr:hypothetical protein [Oscillospiraceae bacterium]